MFRTMTSEDLRASFESANELLMMQWGCIWLHQTPLKLGDLATLALIIKQYSRMWGVVTVNLACTSNSLFLSSQFATNLSNFPVSSELRRILCGKLDQGHKDLGRDHKNDHYGDQRVIRNWATILTFQSTRFLLKTYQTLSRKSL